MACRKHEIDITGSPVYCAAKESKDDIMLSLATSELVGSMDFRAATENYLLDAIDNNCQETATLIRYLVDVLCNDKVVAYMTYIFQNMIDWDVRLGFIPTRYVLWSDVKCLPLDEVASRAKEYSFVRSALDAELMAEEHLKCALFRTHASPSRIMLDVAELIDKHFTGSMAAVLKELCQLQCGPIPTLSWKITVSKLVLYVRCFMYGYTPYVPKFTTQGPAVLDKCGTVVSQRIGKLKYATRVDTTKFSGVSASGDTYVLRSTYSECIQLTRHWKRILGMYMTSCANNACRLVLTSKTDKKDLSDVISAKSAAGHSLSTLGDRDFFSSSGVVREQEVRTGAADVIANILADQMNLGDAVVSTNSSKQHQTIVDELRDMSKAATAGTAFWEFFNKVAYHPDKALLDLGKSSDITPHEFEKAKSIVNRLNMTQNYQHLDIVDMPKGQQLMCAFDNKTGPNDVEDVLMSWLTFWKSHLSGDGKFQWHANNINYKNAANNTDDSVGKVYKSLFITTMNACGNIFQPYKSPRIHSMCVNDMIMMRSVLSKRGCEALIANILGVRPSRVNCQPLTEENTNPDVDKRVVGALREASVPRDGVDGRLPYERAEGPARGEGSFPRSDSIDDGRSRRAPLGDPRGLRFGQRAGFVPYDSDMYDRRRRNRHSHSR